MLEDATRSLADTGYIAALNQKWAPLLEGIPARTPLERRTRDVTAMLMENQALHLGGLNEETRSTNVGSFTKYIFPILRNTFPNLIANQIVSVQPMTAPVGAVFYMDYVYGTSKGTTTAGSVFPRNFDPTYSSEYVKGERVGTGDGVNGGGAGAAVSFTLAFSPVRPLNVNAGVRTIIREVHATTGATVQEAVDNGAGAFTFTPAGANTAGALYYTNGAVSGFKFQNAPANNNHIVAFYYFDGEMSSKTVQASMDVQKRPIEAKAHRIKALWSSEAAEDLNALHGIDAETEMVGAIAQEMGLEIDRLIIDDLFQNSTTTTGAWDRVVPPGHSEIDHLRSMLTQISYVASMIHKRTLRAPANFIVTSTEISSLLAQLTTHGDTRAAFVSSTESPYGPMDVPMALTQHGQYGIYKTGTIMNKLTVYEDPMFTSDMMLIGLKGSSFFDAGYVFAPYIPLQVTATFLDPNDQTFRKGLRSRYGKMMLRPEYYGQLRVLNL
jgi:hypothetical protein